MKRVAWILLGCFAFLATAQAASFDCAKAQSTIEHLICDNQVLSELDSKLGQDYQDVLSKADEEQKQRVIAEQKHWLKFTRNVCEKDVCLKHAYWSRQAELETFYLPKSPLYEHESEKAEAIRQVLATSPLYPRYDTPFCREVFDYLKQMKGIHFVDPVVQTQSYEDPALDPWKRQCQSEPPFHFAAWCDRNIVAANADDNVEACNVGYGLPPFKLYELPSTVASAEKRYFFYADERYGPMNKDWRKPELGGAGLAGFQQIHITQCVTASNRWARAGKFQNSWRESTAADAGQGGLVGKNYNSIVEIRNQYYFLILHEVRGNYWLDVEPTAHSMHPVGGLQLSHRRIRGVCFG